MALYNFVAFFDGLDKVVGRIVENKALVKHNRVSVNGVICLRAFICRNCDQLYVIFIPHRKFYKRLTFISLYLGRIFFAFKLPVFTVNRSVKIEFANRTVRRRFADKSSERDFGINSVTHRKPVVIKC